MVAHLKLIQIIRTLSCSFFYGRKEDKIEKNKTITIHTFNDIYV